MFRLMKIITAIEIGTKAIKGIKGVFTKEKQENYTDGLDTERERQIKELERQLNELKNLKGKKCE